MTPSIFDRFRTPSAAACARRSQLLHWLATGGTLWPDAVQCGWIDITSNVEKPGPKVLLVVAHPDDESECAATIYRITHELGGMVDQAIVTDGAAGFHWAHVAEAFYGLSLSDEDVARRHMPRIRRNEVLKANRILGVRDTYFFDQADTGFTLDATEGLQTWNCAVVRTTLTHLIDREQYDLIFMLLPTEDTHGHHKSVAILLLQAVADLELDRRPAVLGVKTEPSNESIPDSYNYLSGYNLTKTTSTASIWRFDRATTIEGSDLQYSIIANWVVAEHKSQGMFQMELGRRFEQFWLFEVSGTRGITVWDRCRCLLEKARSNDTEERMTAYADWTTRPFHRSLEALAELAARESGASGYAYFKRDVQHNSTTQLAGSYPIEGDLANHSSVAYPLERKGSTSVDIAFAFPAKRDAEVARGRLYPVVAAIRTLWQLETFDTYNGLAKRLAEVELELMDSKIVDRARGLLTSHAAGEPSEAIVRHILNVVRPGPTQRTLEDALATLKDEIEERKLVSRAKEILVGARGISEEQAHSELRRVSRESRKPLKDIALQIIGTR